MKTSCLPHSRREPIVILRKDFLDICDGHATAAKLLSVVEHWTNVKLTMAEEARLRGVEPDEDNLWIYKTSAQWQEDLLGDAGEKLIRQGIAVLEEKGFIEVRSNPNYRWDRTLQYRLNIPLVAASMATLVTIETAETPLRDGRESVSTIIQEITTETTTSASSRSRFTPTGNTQASRESDLFIGNLWHDTFGRYPTQPQLRKTRLHLETAPLDRADAILGHAFDVMAGFKDATPQSLWGLLKKWAAQDWNTERPQPGMVENMRVLN